MRKQLEPVYASDIEYALSVMHPRNVFEIRGIGMENQMYTGYFTSPTVAANVISDWANIHQYRGLYVTLNQLHRGVLARRRPNSFEEAGRIPTTSDNDVIKRRWILTDVDVTRPTGISASSEEVAVSKVVRDALVHWAQEFWHGRIIKANSGNGSHMLLECLHDFSDTEVKNFLQQLPNMVEDMRIASILREGLCKIDTKVFNRGRIGRLYGTYACKGFQLPEQDRIHRKSFIEEIIDAKSYRRNGQARGPQSVKQTDNGRGTWESQFAEILGEGGPSLD